jgi:hypothetical protein
MGHRLQGFIAKLEILEDVRRQSRAINLVRLPQGFAMIPNTEVVHVAIAGPEEFETPPDLQIFVYMSVPLAHWAEQLSLAARIAYVETDYFGGVGAQTAVAWDNGVIAVGPFTSAHGSVSEEPLSKAAFAELPINRVLTFLGVDRGKAWDEFDALGLGKFRNIPYWATPQG